MISVKHTNKKIKTEKENEDNTDVDTGLKKETDEKRDTKESKRELKRERKEKEDKRELREKDTKEKRENKVKEYTQREKEEKVIKVQSTLDYSFFFLFCRMGKLSLVPILNYFLSMLCAQ